MYLVFEDEKIIQDSFVNALIKEGISANAFRAEDAYSLMPDTNTINKDSIEAVLVGECLSRPRLLAYIRQYLDQIPLLAMANHMTLNDKLIMFTNGADDVIKRPMHAQEIIARVGAIQRRMLPNIAQAQTQDVTVYFDGRDPQIGGEIMILPRRERHILEYLVKHKGRRLTKSQIYDFVYGVFESEIDETVIESHISKLRRKLKDRLGYDPIDSKRYLGYVL